VREIVCAWGNDVGIALVSDIDYPILVQYSWYIITANASGKPYVRRAGVTEEGKKTTIYMHRQIVGVGPQYKVDHRDNDGLNNQRSNLRAASFWQNNCNRSTWSKEGFKGVGLDKRKYRARITLDGIERTIGRFDTALDAAKAYDAEAHKAFGEFAWLNFPDDYPPPYPDAPEAVVPF
jgi:hypothetical protein